MPAGGGNGTVIAQGGRFGGWSLYVKDGMPGYDYNFLGLQRTSIVSTKKLGAGKAELRFQFDYDGGGPAKGGQGTLFVNGEKVAEGRIPATQPGLFSADETADVGIDQVSSASMGNIQMELSSASIPASDTRTFGTLKAKKKWKASTFGLSVGAATEYDYQSFSYGLDWSIDLNKSNTSLSASVRRFDDAIDLIGIDGYGKQGGGLPPTTGSGDRTTTDFTAAFARTWPM